MTPDERRDLRSELAAQRWTAHNVRLADGIETMPGQPDLFTTDLRLTAVRRLLRERFGDDLTGVRIADLGCLEGGFATALALDGATVVGIEARPANLAKADLLRRHFGLANLTFELADVKDFTAERFGPFDAVLALGIVYHLDQPAAWLRQLAAVTPFLVVDTHIAPPTEELLARVRADLRDLSPLELEIVGEDSYAGRWYREFDAGISDAARGEQLWASWSNHRSFWLTEDSLLRALSDAGFDLVGPDPDATSGAYGDRRDELSRAFYTAIRTGGPTTPAGADPPTSAAATPPTPVPPPAPATPRPTAGAPAADPASRIRTYEQLLAKHEQAIARSSRSAAARRGQILAQQQAASVRAATAIAAARELLRRAHDEAIGHGEAIAAHAADQLEVAERERSELAALVRRLADDGRALVSSRRWRVGNALGRAFAPSIRRRRDELASTRVLRHAAHADGVQLTPIAPLARPSLPVWTLDGPAEPDPPATDDDRWMLPAARRYDVIVLANVGWDTRQQRPHHLARAHVALGHRVFYLAAEGTLGTERVDDDGVVKVDLAPGRPYDRYHSIPDAGIVAEWMLTIEALRAKYGIADAAVHVHLHSWTPLAWRLRDAFDWRIVYDCMDEWEGFPGMGEALLAAERELVAGADLVVATAERLRQKWAPHNANTVLVRNAVDAEFFVDGCVPSDLLADVPHPIIGFTGALAPWVDFGLIAAVARARPDWTFVLVGDVFVTPDELRGLDRLSNVVLTGLRPYTEMPRYLFWFDVAIIPFVVDQISAAVDPVKFYEYAATGTPIVTTRLPELDEYAHLIHEATDAESFEAAIELALQDRPDASAERVLLARCNTWLDRCVDLDRATAALWPGLSVVIVTYGQLPHTRRCLESLLGNTGHPGLQVIVVDNASTDGTAAYLRAVAAHDPRVQIILNPANRGFAAANNQGLAVATGEVLVLLNNDTEVAPGWHVPLLRHLQDPTVGLVGPRSDNVGNVARIEIPARFGGSFDAFTRHLAVAHAGELFEIRMLGMFCVAMRADVFREVGPLDEGYGIGMFEDDDYAERVRDLGWRVVCARDAFVHHVGQATFRSLIESGEYDALWERNRLRFESRWGRWRANDDVLAAPVDPL